MEVPSNDNEVPYKAADIPQRYTNKPQDVLILARRQVSQDIKDIIACEQPVTIGHIRKRILHIYGQSRTTDRLQHLLERALESCYVDPLSVPGNATYWASASAASGYDKYRKASGRDIEDIPLVEIRNATLLALRQQLSLSVSDLLSQISRLFGFQRRTPKTIQLITRAIEVLEQEGLASRVGDTVTYQSH